MRLVSAVALVVLLVVVPPCVADTDLPLANPGFEQVSAAGPVVGWREIPVEDGPAGSAIPDASVAHSGLGSLRLVNERQASTVVESDPVALEVGHLYRLSGWIRTSGAHPDPTSRYPTAVPACLSMASFPFTERSPAVGGDTGWTRVERLFLATAASDRVRLYLGHAGTAVGEASFDDVRLEEVDDISEYIPPETVRWLGPAYRYDHRGWIVVHVEGAPYERGFQHGFLLADEIAEYARKLGVLENRGDPAAGWQRLRFMADVTLLRGFDEEYLREMRGIADGVAAAGVEIHGDEPDMLDIVTLNSVVDLGQMERAMRVTPDALTGESFLGAAEELKIAAEDHKCSAFAATGAATASGDVVFGQIFMWGGYTGVHWNVVMDLDPTEGHRLVYHTFPGGIHSGADFYINDAGIVIGETTVSQTPYDPSGTPQANRIRKAAQYADSIDGVTEILWRHNNGMYTNDWPIADVKSGEVAIFLLGTHRSRLWRTSDDPAPFGLPGFLWANNNNRDREVRKEYAAQPEDAPYDVVFGPWNRDLAFNAFYREHAGEIDAPAAARMFATSPINRAHACDGKITTTEMARELVFLAHAGKTTLRSKYPREGWRILPADLPGVEPHLSQGWAVISPVFVTERLQASRRQPPPAAPEEPELEVDEVEGLLTVDPERLWRGTVFPAGGRESWFVSGSAAYWEILHDLPEEPEEAVETLGDAMAELNARYLYTVSREEDVRALDAERAYDRYGPYRIPRIKGTVALHQLHLLLGTERFLEIMGAVHERFAGREATTEEILATMDEAAGRPVRAFLLQWLEREGLPRIEVRAQRRQRRGGWEVELTARQAGTPYHVVTLVEVEAGGVRHLRRMELDGASTTEELRFDQRPDRVAFDPLFSVPVRHESFFTFDNVLDDFDDLAIVYGTIRGAELDHELALRYQLVLADAYVEVLPRLLEDAEVDDAAAAGHDLVVLGSTADNAFLRRVAGLLPLELGPGTFSWREEVHARPDEGMYLALASPLAPRRPLYLVLANSQGQLERMTRAWRRDLGSWAVVRGDEVVDRGHHPVERFQLELGE